MTQQWYNKLKRAGFDDIETNDAYEQLKRWDSHWISQRRNSFFKFSTTQDYYYRATHMIESFAWKSAKEKKIWTMHADGVSLRDIAKKCRCPVKVAHAVVVRIRKVMLGDTNQSR